MAEAGIHVKGKRTARIAIAILVVTTLTFACSLRPQAPATYRNPILYADYSDPDVIRVDDRFYMVASTFHFSPGLPVLESRDLVHWTIVAHALRRLEFHPSYDLPGPIDFDDTSERARFNSGLGHR